VVYQNNKLIDGKTVTAESLPDFHQGVFWIKFKQEEKINCIILKEPLEKGQQIKSMKISMVNGFELIKEIQLTTIGHKRIVTFPVQNISGIRIEFEDAKGVPFLSEVETYMIDEKLIEKQ
jgi:alpha-L-fucosidase